MANSDKLSVAARPLSIISIPNLARSRSNLKLNRLYSTTSRLSTAPARANSTHNNNKQWKDPDKNMIMPYPANVNRRLLTFPRPNILNSYLSYNEILHYLDYLKVRYSDFVKLHTLGNSYENRPIRAIEVHWNSDSNLWAQAKENKEHPSANVSSELDEMELYAPPKGRNIVFIEGGTHAREWITVTVALHCIHQLIEKNGRHRDILRKLRFFIVPVVNPDGYEYSKSTNPRWRKNRRPHEEEGYVGTDCNRNFDFHWDRCKSIAKKNTYQGDKPFSEPETKALAQILLKLGSKILFFLSLHSYAQCIMYPWGYTKMLPNNVKLLESLAMAGRNAIKSYSGRYYRVGSISHLTKRTINGSVVDYAYGVVKIPLTLVMELPSHEYGFQPPIERIGPISNESWCGINEMCKHAITLQSNFDAPKNENITQIEINKENNEEDTNEIKEKEIVIINQANIVKTKTAIRNIKTIQINYDRESEPNENQMQKQREKEKRKERKVNDKVKLSQETFNKDDYLIPMSTTDKCVPPLADQFDRVIKPYFNVKKIEHATTGGYYTSLLDGI